MITVIASGEKFECARAIKGTDYIKLYNANNNEIAAFIGIMNFSGYSITGGEWSSPEPTEAERLASTEKAIAILMGV